MRTVRTLQALSAVKPICHGFSMTRVWVTFPGGSSRARIRQARGGFPPLVENSFHRDRFDGYRWRPRRRDGPHSPSTQRSRGRIVRGLYPCSDSVTAQGETSIRRALSASAGTPVSPAETTAVARYDGRAADRHYRSCSIRRARRRPAVRARFRPSVIH
jgi:hypothetical protein